jgi:hypothetical protein
MKDTSKKAETIALRSGWMLVMAAALASGACSKPLLMRSPKAAVPMTACDQRTLPKATTSDPLLVELNNGNTKGTVRGQRVHLAAGVTIVLSGDLTILALTDIDIEGEFEFPDVTGDGTPSPNLLLVAGGKIQVSSTGKVGNGKGKATTGVAPHRGLYYPNGGSGGQIMLAAASRVEVNGEINGHAGGKGFDDSGATAAGGNGGDGGDVVLCSSEKILVRSIFLSSVTISPGAARAGNGGGGGKATSQQENPATATGGNGGNGGSVYFMAEASLAKPIPVEIGDASSVGYVTGGDGGPAGIAAASGEDQNNLTANNPGGSGTATGGNGGDGGSVINLPAPGVTCGGPGITKAGDGGKGEDATASGGKGDNTSRKGPNNGGSATATGGNGGKAGPATTCSAKGGGGLEKPGPGGKATATSGSGGNATGVGVPGASGTATTTGGSNGAGLAPTPPSATAIATPATPGASGVGGTGGAGTTKTCAGQP